MVGRRALRQEWPGLALLGCVLVFWAVALADEVRIGRVPLNDSVFHLAAAERLGESFRRGEPFLDPWVSEWSLGYPVWRSYQPLPPCARSGVPGGSAALRRPCDRVRVPHLRAARVAAGQRVRGRTIDEFRPGGRRPRGATLAPSEAGEYGRYGLGLGAYVWRGSGLYTQLVAIHFLTLALGATARALDTGRGRAVAALFSR
jgi:hypothetical protein